MVEGNARSARRDGGDETGERSDEGHTARNHPGDAVEPNAENPARNIRDDHVVPTVVRYQRRELSLIVNIVIVVSCCATMYDRSSV